MDDIELRALLDLLMCIDPWPVPDKHNQGIVESIANQESIKRGYSSWIDAYHMLLRPGADNQLNE